MSAESRTQVGGAPAVVDDYAAPDAVPDVAGAPVALPVPVMVGPSAGADASPDLYPRVTAAFRVGIVVLAVWLGVLRGNLLPVAPWLVAVLLPEGVVRLRRLSARQLTMLAAWWALIASIGIPFTGGGTSPLLPLLVVASFLAGLAGGAYGATVLNGFVSLLLLIGWVVRQSHHVGNTRVYFGAASEWVVLGLGVGLLMHWIAPGRREPADDHDVRYQEARGLLRQLEAVTAGLPGNLDVTTTCEVLLDSCLRYCGASKGAVLTDVGDGYLVPMALHGTRRVPWRSPLAGPGPLQLAWTSGEVVLDERPRDSGGRRAGSAVLVAPIKAPEGALGLVVLQGDDRSAFDGTAVRDIEATIRRTVLQLETARLFDAVRGRVTMDERARLAREMHDGVAQDLAYVGFELDSLRLRASKIDGELATSIAELRRQTTRVISDIRASISDLRSSGSVDRGLGAALASYVRNLGTTGRLTVHLSLQESTFRLQAETEVLLFRLAQGLAASVRDHSEARNLWVNLFVDPPTGALRIAHDGSSGFRKQDLEQAATKLAGSGITLTVSDREPIGSVAEAIFGGGDGDDATAAG